MPYRAYAGSAADFFADLRQDGTFVAQPFATATVYDDDGGRPVTDLRTMTNAAITKVTADSAGNFQFQAPDTYGTLWIKPTVTGSRYYPVQPSRIADDLRTYLRLIEDAQGTADEVAGTVRELTPPTGTRYLAVPLGDPGVASVPVVDARGVMVWVALSSLVSGTGGTGGSGGGGGTTPLPTGGPATFAATFADARF